MDKTALEDKTSRKSCWFDNAAGLMLLHQDWINKHQNRLPSRSKQIYQFLELKVFFFSCCCWQKWNFWPQKWQRCCFKAHKACRPV